MTQKWFDLYPTITLDTHLTVFNPDDKLLGLIIVFMNKHKGIEKLES